MLTGIVVRFAIFLCYGFRLLIGPLFFFITVLWLYLSHSDVSPMRYITPMRTEHMFVIWSCIEVRAKFNANKAGLGNLQSPKTHTHKHTHTHTHKHTHTHTHTHIHTHKAVFFYIPLQGFCYKSSLLCLCVCGFITFMRRLFVIVSSAFLLAASILYKSTAGRYRPVSSTDGSITARYRFIKNAYWASSGAVIHYSLHDFLYFFLSSLFFCTNSIRHNYTQSFFLFYFIFFYFFLFFFFFILFIFFFIYLFIYFFFLFQTCRTFV